MISHWPYCRTQFSDQEFTLAFDMRSLFGSLAVPFLGYNCISNMNCIFCIHFFIHLLVFCSFFFSCIHIYCRRRQEARSPPLVEKNKDQLTKRRTQNRLVTRRPQHSRKRNHKTKIVITPTYETLLMVSSIFHWILCYQSCWPSSIFTAI